MPHGYDHLLVLDLETTGTDEKKDAIIECAGILVDGNLDEIARWETTILPSRTYTMDPFVHDMHTKNGLLEALATKPDFRSDSEADGAWSLWLSNLTGSTKHVALSGSGVGHFDRRFIKEKWPRFDRRLTYFPLDVGNVRRIAVDLAGVDPALLPDQDSKTHRAMADATFHLAELRFWTVMLKQCPF